MGFRQIKNKIQTVYNQINQSFKIDYPKKTNLNLIIPNQDQILSTPKILYDSGWITEEATGGFESTIKGIFRPTYLLYDLQQDFELPSELLPFLKINVLSKHPPNTEISSAELLDYDSYNRNDNIEVKGDGNLIYRGIPKIAAFTTYYFEQDLLDGKFLESNTKKVWGINITFTRAGTQYRIQPGLIRTFSWTQNVGTGCGGGQNTDQLFCEINQTVKTDDNNDHKIHNINTTSIEMTGLKTEIRWITNPSPPPSCLQSVITTNDQKIIRSFASMARQSMQIYGNREKFEGGEWVSEGTDSYTVDTNTDTINSQEFSLFGYYLYYSSQTRWLFGVTYNLTLPEGVSFYSSLANVPNTNSVPGISLPYSSITFNKNHDDLIQVITAESFIKYISHKIWLNLGHVANNIYKYRLLLDGAMLISAPATEETDVNFMKYTDVYSQSGTTYSRTENHVLNVKKEYAPPNQLNEYRIVVSSQPPINYSTIESVKEI